MGLIPDRQALQPERTALAWQRTAVIAIVLLVPVLVVGVRLGAWWVVAVVSGGAVTGAWLLLDVHRRFAQLRDDTRGYSPFPMILRVAGVTLVGALGGIALAVQHALL
ncbi:MAG TPA: DUF202 domain-containing protein [Pedococcus sp.]|jgi:hypothetical protein